MRKISQIFVAFSEKLNFNAIFGSDLIQSLNNLIEHNFEINVNWIICDRSKISKNASQLC